ncbi:uncharacterized protein C10orf105-like [Corythoichthys intestinalis]|uniref:uncharacterized protein C10orf105-like n=1 Tax=Corythoichthys intestinalis TaxID=161448 RepID=UPI0025A5BC65|nr:uncharacterized protein C10orf105-like [Corythoichthys intestinalis]
MNTSHLGTNLTIPSTTDDIVLNVSTAATAPTTPSYSLDTHDPEFTIMVVIGLSVLLAGLAIFLAFCRRSEQDEGCEASCGETLKHGRSQSSEPQLKVWKRLGSYRRSYNLSFRRPPHRRPHQHRNARASDSPGTRTAQPGVSTEPHLTMPCLCDYVTEI